MYNFSSKSLIPVEINVTRYKLGKNSTLWSAEDAVYTGLFAV
jgi:hypothetical protein